MNTNNGNLNNNNKNNNNYVLGFVEFLFIIISYEKYTFRGFFKAYYDCRKHKRNTLNQLEFEANYEENLVKLCEEVNNRTYKIGKSICFVITRPKLREVFAADFRDRIIHHIIIMRIEPLLESIFIEDNYNCRKEKGVLYGVKRLYEQIGQCSENYTKDCYVSKFDMKGFFMSIHKPTLWNMLSKFIKDNYKEDDIDLLLYLINVVITNRPQDNCIKKSNEIMWERLPKDKSLFTCGEEYGMPIGNLTSLMFANFYLSLFDIKMKNRYIYYGRYVDDYFIISTNKKDIVNSISIAKDYLYTNLLVTLHPHKIYIQHYSKGIKFTGSVVKKNRMYISNTTVSNMTDAIRHANDSIGIDSLHFMQSLNSYFGFLKHYRTFKIKSKIIQTIDNDWYKHINILNLSKAELKQ